ncbi:bifunctional UDP-N-acetylglucosamine diphosphorylase/glucosamine-1-phosphate N-acetyltransferase GlmU [Flexibacterium corallicola]|uniref:bifunctional UDP-N-acetylglucosamine diphosphorylase/glucosamine-1-phosphate N-acetyltransferase GlmU n=1 Tax=Flexibacterium corallicola TaxID=3037259 RepID=UPI00286EC761|nr:bifunctional UDP-N-acetylglucosamine diphosphorylase/glucosamine-1-phosphate N-acetyltransferase GlmU [Pseudovibrio sp. M1P-2-3]
MDSSCLAIVLAAGLGTRMRSSLPKVMHEVGNLPLVGHVLRAVNEAGADKIAVVVGPNMPVVEEAVVRIAPNASNYTQVDRLGTAHAVKAAESAYLEGHDHVLVLFGDTPLVTAQTFNKLRHKLHQGADIAVLGFSAKNPFGYGRLLVENGQLKAIREEKDASEQERKVQFCNAGIMAFKGKHLQSIVAAIGNSNAKGEYYLTDAVEIGRDLGLKVVAEEAEELEVQGINNREQLANCERVFQEAMRSSAMEQGVTLKAPETVFFSYDTEIANDVVIEPNVVFGPGVQIETGAQIRAFSHLEQAVVRKNAIVGPYARLRPNSDIGSNARIGNFVEIKNTRVETGAKVNHLSYIGDATIGEKSNIGAGAITCNYDGFLKHKTTIGSGVFVGSDSVLVAPVSIADGAYVAAGSVITENISENDLALARSRQTVKPGRASEIRERLSKAKKEQKNS